MLKKRRYTDIAGGRHLTKIITVLTIASLLLSGCGGKSVILSESAADLDLDFQKMKKENSDVFAWLYIPDTGIDYPMVQSSEGDDEYDTYHNAAKQEDPKGAIYIDAANLSDMCDFNVVIHGSAPSDGTMFGNLDKFLDRAYFEEHDYAYVYRDDNALTYYIIAAYTRDQGELLQQYDFSYASGCQEFIDEIYDSRNMTKIIRSGCEEGLKPEHFLITLTAPNKDIPGKQTVVIGCLVGDAAGIMDREIDYGDGEYLE